MAAPVLVRAYHSDVTTSLKPSGAHYRASQTLPPISSYAFADILRSADCPELQHAINGIAEICAKNHMSLSDEYSSHMPPQGEITAATSAAVRPQQLRPGMRRALTSVPEASSGSSEGSHKSKKRASGLFSFRRKEIDQIRPMESMRIGRGRTIPVTGTTALGSNIGSLQELDISKVNAMQDHGKRTGPTSDNRHSEAASSLQRLLAQRRAPLAANS